MFIPVIKLFFEKFKKPESVYVKFMSKFPKCFPLYGIFLNSILSLLLFKTLVFFGAVIFKSISEHSISMLLCVKPYF